jgi:hypothetical protein
MARLFQEYPGVDQVGTQQGSKDRINCVPLHATRSEGRLRGTLALPDKKTRWAMNLLVELVGSFESGEGIESLFRRLPEALQAMGFEVLHTREDRREIEFRCLVPLLGLGLWRCWADKAILRLKPSDKLTTRVDLYCVPNPLCLKVKPGEPQLGIAELEAAVRRVIVVPFG